MKTAFDISLANYRNILDNEYHYAVLPWGATEPHNYHLPYMTDCYLAHDIALDAVLESHKLHDIKGLVLPYIALGSQNPGQFDMPFCLHASYQTQVSILRDIVLSLNRQGMDKLFIVNGHGGNNFKNMVRDLAVELPNFLIVVVDWFKVEPQDPYFENKDDHAGEQETSVLLHYRPQLIDMSVAGEGKYTPFRSQSLNDGIGWTPRNWTRVSEDTGTADPRKATAEKGAKYAAAVVAKIVKLFAEVVKESIYR